MRSCCTEHEGVEPLAAGRSFLPPRTAVLTARRSDQGESAPAMDPSPIIGMVFVIRRAAFYP
jgi:hypothetical protein